MMTKMGPPERVVRIALGVALLSGLLALPGDLRWVGLAGLFPLVTGLFAWCPFYVLLDWFTLD